jgi:uncharacterized protein YecE (DUF72 family)
MPQTRIGVSGWNYDGWRGPFYPRGLPAARQLAYASRQFNSLEINGSFYSLKTPETYRHWYEQTPRGFVFALKGSRFITHNKKLRDAETPLANFFASGVLLLKEKLGPIVWQLPANARFDAARVEAFFELLPRDTERCAMLAARHDTRVRGRSWTSCDRKRPMRHVLEVRHESFLTGELVALARRHRVALACSDAADWPYTEEITAGFVYLRLHGHTRTYASRYSTGSLREWARRIRLWRAGGEPGDAARITTLRPLRHATRDVYVYFDNDQRAHAPRDARRLAAIVGASPPARDGGNLRAATIGGGGRHVGASSRKKRMA